MSSAAPKKASIFDKLTDSSQYTGAHKERFGSDGQGKGKAGRVDEVKPTGYVHGFGGGATEPVVVAAAPAPMSPKPAGTTPKSPKPAGAGAGAGAASPKKAGTPKKKEGGSIFDKLTDSSQYVGAHKERFGADGQGKGKAGRTDEVKTTGYVHGFTNAKHLV